LEHVLRRIQALPPLPTSALRVIALTKNPATSVQELETVIAQDPALAASMLRQANSSYYGYARRISSLQEAIVVLGFQATQGLAMVSAVAPFLKTPLVGYEIEQEGLWKHSMLTAMTAKRLCQNLKLPIGDVAFTAGLLHDIGKLIISIYVQEVGPYLLKKVNEAKLAYVELEEKVIGYNHATVGGMLSKHWNLPDNLVTAITCHHFPSGAEAHIQLASIINVADALACSLGIGGGVDSFLNPLQPETLDQLGLKESDLEQLMASLGDLLADPTLFST
jgi:uncharacterized domain HDIG